MDILVIAAVVAFITYELGYRAGRESIRRWMRRVRHD